MTSDRTPRRALRTEVAPQPAEPGRRARRSRTTNVEPSIDVVPVSGLSRRQAVAQSRSEAHELYTAARDAWTAAMKAAASGRPADLAALAITQEAYEAATAELEQWESGERVAIAVETDRSSSVGAVVGQELAWRKVHEPEAKVGPIGRVLRRLRGR